MYYSPFIPNIFQGAIYAKGAQEQIVELINYFFTFVIPWLKKINAQIYYFIAIKILATINFLFTICLNYILF